MQGHSAIFGLVNQPFCPPPMVFEKRVEPPKERIVLTKAAAIVGGTKTQTLQVVREAMQLTEDKYRTQLDGKDKVIERQQEMLIAQKKQLLDLQNQNRDPNVIQITEI
jgi:hypothetical protein